MKTDKFATLRIGDRYNEGEYDKAVCSDLQLIKRLLTHLISNADLSPEQRQKFFKELEEE